MAYSLNKINSLIHLVLIICLYTFNSVFPFLNFKRYHLLTLIVYAIILNLSSFFFVKNGSISLKKIFHIFLYIFFGLAPLIQYKNDVYFFKTKLLNHEDFLLGGILTVLIIISYNVFGILLKKYKIINRIKINLEIKNGLKNKPQIIGALLSLFLIFFLSIYLDYRSLYTRKYIDSLSGYNYNVVSFLRDSIRSLPLIYLLIFKLNKTKDFYFEIFLISLILIMNFPTAISRYQVGLIYLPILYVYLTRLRNYFIWIFSFGILVVLPYLQYLRYNVVAISYNYNFIEFFSSLHFDTFQNTLSIIKLNIITYGEQMMGAFLFFIPHSLWEEKTDTSSFLLCDKIEYDGFCNVAVSFFGEGYINFGFFGLIIFLIILVIINESLDTWFLKSKNNLFKALFLCLVFYEFYLLRGSLNSSIEKLAILVFSFIIYITLNYSFVIFNIKKL